MIVIVTGGRINGADQRSRLHRALYLLHVKYGITELVLGDCPTGTDAHAREWMPLIPRTVQIANWVKHGKRGVRVLTVDGVIDAHGHRS